MKTNANDFFGSSNGTGVYFRHKPSALLYTEGIKELAEGCEAYWLIDLIMSHQPAINADLQRFQVWELRRVKDDKFYIFATDGNGYKLASQHIPFSDFKYDHATLWLADDCLLLPVEW